MQGKKKAQNNKMPSYNTFLSQKFMGDHNEN
jgi:hypothetical protein